tara:strand:+ start:52 stop:2733 length:2682 start_codon:yes stop_codon:yes gene_type:complete
MAGFGREPPKIKEDNSTKEPISDLAENGDTSFEDAEVLANRAPEDLSQLQSVEGEEVWEWDQDNGTDLGMSTAGGVEGVDSEGNRVRLSELAAKLAREKALKEAAKIREGNNKVAGSRRKKRESRKGIFEQTEQAYLIQNIESFIASKNIPKPEDMNNLILANSEGNLINTLTIGTRLLPLMGITPAQLSSLIPYIRFFKSKKSTTGKRTIEEFKFSTAAPDMKEYFASGTNSYKNVGLKSFSWETNGDNLFNARRSLTAEIVLSFSSMIDLQKPPAGLSWMDLILHSPENTKEEDEADQVDPEKIEILAEMGYKYPDNADLSPELKAALEDSRVFLSLYPNQTEFDFKEDGSIELKVSYTASGEFLSDQYTSNVLTIGTKNAPDKTEKELKRVKGEIATNKSNLEDEKESEAKEALKDKRDELQEELEKATSRNRASNYTKFLQYLVGAKRLFSFTVSEDQYKSGILPKSKNLGNIFPDNIIDDQAIKDLIKEFRKKEKAGKNLDNKPTPTGKRTISYFYLGDLINYTAKALEQNGELISEVVVGDYEFYLFPPPREKKVKNKKGKIETQQEQLSAEDLKNVHRIRVNLSSMPISLDMYNLFMYENVMKRGSPTFTFDNFIKKVATELIDNALDSFVSNRVGEDARKKFTEDRASIKATTVSGHSKELKEKKGSMLDIPAPIPAFRIAPPRLSADGGFEPPSNFFIIYGSRVPAWLRLDSDEQKNAESGVYHLTPGSDRGIVKGVKFKQMESRLRDQRILKSRETGNVNTGVLKLPYNSTVELFGSSPFYPGQAVFISPALTGVGSLEARRSIATDLGLGGYYIVHKISSEISMGILQSSLDCTFQSFPLGKDELEDNDGGALSSAKAIDGNKYLASLTPSVEESAESETTS